MAFPPLYNIRQKFDNSFEPDIRGAVVREIRAAGLERRVKPGQSVAVAVGSRGIENIREMTAATVQQLRLLGLRPYIVPAMGSHGGATGEGQAAVLAELGVTEDSAGAPVVSSMDVVSLGFLENGAEVSFSRDALEADHLVLINRVKRHTAFRGEIESGLCKMLAVGCGKHQGAVNMHKYGLASSIIDAARLILSRTPVLFGLAVLENALAGTHSVRLVPPERFLLSDAELLKEANDLFPSLPLDRLDILLVDEMGKNISGVGMDPNVIGMWRREGGPRLPDYRTVVVLNLTPESRGNAVGIGLADLTTRRLIESIDIEATYANTLATGIWASARLPIALENDRAALEMALSKAPAPEHVRLVRIRNTLRLESFWASRALLPELGSNPRLEVSDSPVELQFGRDSILLPFPPETDRI